jgi:hypothetical protein
MKRSVRYFSRPWCRKQPIYMIMVRGTEEKNENNRGVNVQPLPNIDGLQFEPVSPSLERCSELFVTLCLCFTVTSIGTNKLNLQREKRAQFCSL